MSGNHRSFRVIFVLLNVMNTNVVVLYWSYIILNKSYYFTNTNILLYREDPFEYRTYIKTCFLNCESCVLFTIRKINSGVCFAIGIQVTP